MDDLPLHDDVGARETDALTLQAELGEDEVRRRRADVDADGAETQPFARDVAGVVVLVVPEVAMFVMAVRVMRVAGWRGFRRGR